MTDEFDITTGYTTYSTTSGIDVESFDIEAMAELIETMRQKIDSDLLRAVTYPPAPLWKSPKIEYEPEQRPFGMTGLYGMGFPVYESRFVPMNEGLYVAGYGVVIGTGPAIDPLANLGLDITEELGIVYYELPAWAMFAILAAALMLLVMVLA